MVLKCPLFGGSTVDRIRNMESKGELSHTDQLDAKRLQQRLTNRDGEVGTYHLGVVDLLEEDLHEDTEQAVLDEHHDRISGLTIGHAVALKLRVQLCVLWRTTFLTLTIGRALLDKMTGP